MQINYRGGRKGVPALQYLSDVLKEFCFGDRTTKIETETQTRTSSWQTNCNVNSSANSLTASDWTHTQLGNAYPEHDLHFKELSVSKRTFILQKPALRQQNTP